MDRSWAVKALGAWIGTLLGVGIYWFSSFSDFGAQHPFAESMGLVTGWALAMGSPIAFLQLIRTRWSDESPL
jgi:hypothetical protein